MIDTKKTEIKGLTFYIKPFSGFAAVKLDKAVIQLISPALKGLDGDLGVIGSAISETLSQMNERSYETFLKNMLSETLVEVENFQDPQPVMTQFDSVFQGNIMALYQLLYEIMEHNRFSFFELVGGGFGIQKTGLSKEASKIKRKFGKK